MVSRTRKAFRLQLLPLIAGFAVLAAIVGTRSLLIESQQAANIAVLPPSRVMDRRKTC